MYFSKITSLIFGSILVLAFCNCESKKNKDREDTYFGGEVVNPNTDYIILSKGDTYQDTIYLDENNRFLFKLKDFKEGLYSFRHNPEYQIVMLEKGDSILIRLNTLEFDESLVFTGDGARKNNFIIDMFLQNEIERGYLEKSDFRLNPTKFKQKQDSLLKVRNKRYEKLIKKYELSDLAKEICKSSYQYDFYSRFEMYFYRYQYSGLSNIESFKDIPTNFFDYRENIDFNNDHLKRLYSYYRFLNHYFVNSSYAKHHTKNSFFKNTDEYTIHKLNLIDSTIQHSYIKNNLFKGTATSFILDNKNNYTSDKVLNHYLKICTNDKFKKELTELATVTSKLQPNKVIPDQELISSNGKNTHLSALFKKPITALYFWSIDQKQHYIRAHKKAKELNAIYPKIDFIGINTDDNQTNNWQKTIKRNQFNLNNEYEFRFPECSSKELVINYRNKVILINQQGKIINPNADLFSTSFANQLEEYYTNQIE